MVTNKLKTIFAVSVLLFIVHGLEEMFTGFYELDAWDQAIFSPLAHLSVHGAMFVTFQIMFWILLIVVSILLLNERAHVSICSLFQVSYTYSSYIMLEKH